MRNGRERVVFGVALTACVVGASCARDTEINHTPAFSLNLQLTPAAEQRLRERHAKAEVYVDIYGIAKTPGAKHADEMDRIMLVPEQAASTTTSQVIRFEGRPYPRRRIGELLDGKVMMDIGAGHYDREHSQTLLTCDVLTGAMSEILAGTPVLRCDVFKS